MAGTPKWLGAALVLALLSGCSPGDSPAPRAPDDAATPDEAPASVETAEPAEPADTSVSDASAERTLGVGFLWTQQSRQAVKALGRPGDFVDVIIGPGKMDVFKDVQLPVRVACIARSLERNDARPFPGIRETIDILKGGGIAPERVIISYNPERQPGTPAPEVDNLVDSVRRAREIAKEYGAPLLVGPGLREMQDRGELYPELARNCDIWMIQSQRLQLDLATRKPVSPNDYRAAVKRIVDALHSGNPDLPVYVQLVTTAERGTTALTADQLAAWALSVRDLVAGVRIYGGSAELLAGVVGRLGAAASSGEGD